MAHKKVVILIVGVLLFLMLALPFVFAVQPSQQYAKIFLNPFYRASMTSNTNYTYTLGVFTPDKIGQVYSSIIAFDIYLTPTVNYDLWVNGQPCNNPRYTVSTTYSGAAQGRLYFDCSNRIKGEGFYNITIRADKNSGASVSWIDLTYSNQPKADIKVMGTEYTQGQIAKPWLQLLDSNGSYINDGACFVDVYTPDGNEFIEGAEMINMNHDGIYYYDIDTSIMVEGVYPVIAKCYYTALENKNYMTSYYQVFSLNNLTIATDNFQSGNFAGGTGWQQASWQNTIARTTIVTWNGSLAARGEGNFDIDRQVNLSGYSTGYLSFKLGSQSLEAGDSCNVEYFNGAAWTTIATQNGVIVNQSLTYNINVTPYGLSGTSAVGFFTINNENGNDFCFLDDVVFTGVFIPPTANLTKLNALDNNYATFWEYYNNSISHLDVQFNVTDVQNCSKVSEGLLTGLDVFVNGRFSSVPNDDISISIWNFTSGTWHTLPNTLPQGITYNSVSNSISLSNVTTAGLYNSAQGGFRIRLTDSNFADTANSPLTLDYVYLGCNQLTGLTWQEVKGSSEIHISSSGDEAYYEESLCGSQTVNGYESACSEFLNNASYWNTTWGYIHDRLLFINNYQSTISTIEQYETPLGQDCTSLIDVTLTKNNVTTSIIDDVTLKLGTRDNCLIGIPVEFVPSDREFTVDVYEDNYMKWEMQRDKDYAQYFELAFEPWCNNIATQNNNPFVIPIDSLGSEVDVSALYADNPIYLGCYRALDDLYWFNKYYTDSLSVSTSGVFESYLSEARFYYPELKTHAQIVQQLSSLNVLSNVQTICEVDGTTDQEGEGYGCAVLKSPDSTFTSQEGYIVENLTVVNTFNGNIDTSHKYTTARGMDCTSVFSVLKINGTTTEIKDDIIYKSGTKDNCEMTIPINYVQGQPSYQIEIYMENYILWDIYWAKDLVNSFNDTIIPYCNDIATNRSISYIIPINQSIEQYRNDSELYFCYRAVDDVYWWYYFYDKLLTEGYTTVGPLESIHYESEFFWPRILDDYNVIKTYQRNINQIQTLQEILDLRDTVADRVWNATNIDNMASLSLSGTEYTPGDPATVFLQLVDNNGNPINNASCNLDIFAPYNGSTHPIYISSAPMIYLTGDSGLYYYDLTAPTTLGVYMLSARCNYGFASRSTIYLDTDTTNKPSAQYQLGTWVVAGSEQVLNSPFDSLYMKCSQTGGGQCIANFTFDTQIYGAVNATNVTVYWGGQTTTAGAAQIFYWNGTTWVATTAKTTIALGTSTVPSPTDQYLSVSIPASSIIAGNVKLQLRGNGTGTWVMWSNWLSLELTTVEGPIVNVRGSNEMHVTNIPNATSNLVWNYTNRTLTYIPPLSVDIDAVAQAVWNYTTRNLTYYPTSSDLTNYTLITQLVWNYVSRNLTYTPDMTNYNLIQTMVWNSTDRNLTYYAPASVDTNAVAQAVWNFTNRNLTYYNLGNNLAATDVWNYVSRNLTYYQQVDNTNYTLITQNVWNYNNRSLTYYQVNNISVSDIWNYVNRSLTQNVSEEVWLYYNRTLTYIPDMTNYSLIGDTVWQYVNRSLTQNIPLEVWTFNSRNLTQNISADVWSYYNKTLTYYPDVTNYSLIYEGVWNYANRSLTTTVSVDLSSIAQSVWNFTNRNLTYYPTQLDLTNYTLITELVWNYVSRNLTYIPDLTNYNLIQTLVWNSTNRNLTYYPTQLDLTNYTLIGETVWNFVNRNLTYYELGNNLSANDIWNYVSRNLTYYEQQDNTNYSLITENIWNYNNRTLTYYEVNNISVSDIWNYANRSLTQNVSQEVWTYYDRTLTYYNMSDTTDYNKLQEMVWNYTNRSLTQDLPLEIWSFQNRTLTQNISAEVWTFYNRTLTYYPDVTNYSLINEGVWNYANRSLTGFINIDLDSIANAVWNFTNRNLTYYPAQLDLTNYTLITELVWNYVSRNLTYTPDMTNYNLIQTMVWNSTDRNLTYYPTQIDLTNYTLIGQTVWDFANRNLTYYDLGNDLSASDVWNYVSRNLTYYEQVDSTNYTLITENVWSYNNRTLTYYEVNNISVSDIWNYVNRSLTQNVSEEVWLYYNKTLTYYPATTDETNYSLIGDTVWQYVNRSLTQDLPLEIWTYTNRTMTQNFSLEVWTFYNRTLTYYPDVTNYSLISEGVWNYVNRSLTTSVTVDLSAIADSVWNFTNRNLTYYPTQLDLTNYTLISELVWNYVDRNLTYIPDLTNYLLIQGLVWNATDRNLTYYLPTDITGVAEAVWNFTNRNLTYYDLGNNLAASDVWNYVSRNLTYYEQQDNTNYSLITENVWSYNNRSLTYYEVNNISVLDIWNYANRSLTQNVSEEVWLYYNRTLTYYPDVTNYTLMGDTIWQYTNRSLTQDLPFEIWTYSSRNLTQNISLEVWTYYNKTLTYYPDVTNYSLINEGVWNYVDRNLTYYPAQIDLTNYTLINEGVWSYFNRTLTDFDFLINVNMSSLNMTEVAENVWNYGNRSLTFYQVNNISANDVWTYVNRSLTDYNQTAPTDLTDYNLIQLMVWNNTDRNLTYYPTQLDLTNYTKIVEDNWNYNNRSLTFYEVTQVNATDIAINVWQNNNRTLTYYQLNNITAQDIWGYVNRNLTYYQDVTNYALIQEMVWNATTRSLTELNLTVTVNATAIANAVWNSVNRTLTDYNQSDLTNYNLIQQVVWNATIRTLTDFNFTVNATINNTDVASSVWAYTNKTVQFANGSVDTVQDIQDMGHTYVGGTEYISGDSGKITIRLVRGTGSLAEIELGATCIVSITYPNGTFFITNASMSELGNGAYYYDFTVPPTLGIYPYFTDCNVSDRLYFSLDDFHVYETNFSTIPTTVWNYNAGRNLTYYPLVNVTNLTVNVNNTAVAEGVWSYNGTINHNILSQIGEYTWTVFNNIHDFITGIWSAPSRTLTAYESDNCRYTEYGYYNKDLPMLRNVNCN